MSQIPNYDPIIFEYFVNMTIIFEYIISFSKIYEA